MWWTVVSGMLFIVGILVVYNFIKEVVIEGEGLIQEEGK